MNTAEVGEIIGVNSVAISPDGTTIAAGCDDNNLRLWKKSEDGKFQSDSLRIYKDQAHTGSIRAVAFSPDSKNLYTGSLDNTLKTWVKDGDVWAFHEVASFVDTGNASPEVEKKGIVSIAVSASSNNPYVVCGSNYDGKIRIFKKNKDGKLDLLQTLTLPKNDNGSYVESGKVDLLQTLELPNNDNGSYVESLSFSPDGNFFLAGVNRGNCLLYGLTSPMPASSGGGGFLAALNRAMGNPATTTTPVTTTPVTTTPVTTTPVNSKNKVFTFIQELKNSINACTVSFSNDGNQIIIGKGTEIELFYKDATGMFVHKKDEHNTDIEFYNEYEGMSITSIDFSPDGTKILYGDYGNNVVIGTIPTDNGDKLVDSQTLADHTEEVTSVKFSPDGTFIVSGSMDGTVKIWKTDTGKYSLSQTFTMYKNDIDFDDEDEEEEYEGGGKKSKRNPRTTKKKRPTKKRKHRRTKITKKKKPTKKR